MLCRLSKPALSCRVPATGTCPFMLPALPQIPGLSRACHRGAVHPYPALRRAAAPGGGRLRSLRVTRLRSAPSASHWPQPRASIGTNCAGHSLLSRRGPERRDQARERSDRAAPAAAGSGSGGESGGSGGKKSTGSQARDWLSSGTLCGRTPSAFGLQDGPSGWGRRGSPRSKFLAVAVLAAAVGAICLFSPLGDDSSEHGAPDKQPCSQQPRDRASAGSSSRQGPCRPRWTLKPCRSCHAGALSRLCLWASHAPAAAS